MKKETEYHGYRIVCRSTGRLFAQIFPPGCSRALKETPVANLSDGFELLIDLAKRMVDQDLSARHDSRQTGVMH